MQEKNRHLYEMPVLKFEMKKEMNAFGHSVCVFFPDDIVHHLWKVKLIGSSYKSTTSLIHCPSDSGSASHQGDGIHNLVLGQGCRETVKRNAHVRVDDTDTAICQSAEGTPKRIVVSGGIADNLALLYQGILAEEVAILFDSLLKI